MWSFWVTLGLSKPGNIIIRPRDKPVLDRIEMDIIDMPGKIVGITHRMLPKPALPNPALSFGGAGL